MRPSLTGMTRPISTSIASVPASIRSSLVTTASVLLPGEAQSFKSASKGLFKTWKKNLIIQMFSLPSGSTSRATLRASEVAMSVLAAVTARMMQLGLEMCFRIRSLIWTSMSLGWSPTGTWGEQRQLKAKKVSIGFLSMPQRGISQINTCSIRGEELMRLESKPEYSWALSAGSDGIKN